MASTDPYMQRFQSGGKQSRCRKNCGQAARWVLLPGVLLLLSCGTKPNDPLRHGIIETPAASVFWLTINNTPMFILSAAKADEISEGIENWEGTEFNVTYTLRTQGKRILIHVYGDINEGIITAAFRNEPLDLEQGTFFVETDGRAVNMAQPEIEKWLSKTDWP